MQKAHYLKIATSQCYRMTHELPESRFPVGAIILAAVCLLLLVVRHVVDVWQKLRRTGYQPGWKVLISPIIPMPVPRLGWITKGKTWNWDGQHKRTPPLRLCSWKTTDRRLLVAFAEAGCDVISIVGARVISFRSMPNTRS